MKHEFHPVSVTIKRGPMNDETVVLANAVRVFTHRRSQRSICVIEPPTGSHDEPLIIVIPLGDNAAGKPWMTVDLSALLDLYERATGGQP
jgi:hypothetical protein